MDNAPEPELPRQAQLASQPGETPQRQEMEVWISYVLRWGVMIAGAIIAVGLLLLLLQTSRSGQPASLAQVRAAAGQPISIDLATILSSAAHGQAAGIIELGLLALILTPITRVAMTAMLFFVQRDHIFTVITCIVLLILIAGLVGVGS